MSVDPVAAAKVCVTFAKTNEKLIIVGGAMGETQLDADGIQALPGSLHEAIEEMEKSELVADTLGEHVFEWFVRNKRAEWLEYKTQVSQFELDRYLPSL